MYGPKRNFDNNLKVTTGIELKCLWSDILHFSHLCAFWRQMLLEFHYCHHSHPEEADLPDFVIHLTCHYYIFIVSEAFVMQCFLFIRYLLVMAKKTTFTVLVKWTELCAC